MCDLASSDCFTVRRRLPLMWHIGCHPVLFQNSLKVRPRIREGLQFVPHSSGAWIIPSSHDDLSWLLLHLSSLRCVCWARIVKSPCIVVQCRSAQPAFKTERSS